MDLIVPNSELPAYLRKMEAKRFGIRAVAFLIDWMIHVGVTFGMMYVVAVLFGVTDMINTGHDPIQSAQDGHWLVQIISTVVTMVIGWILFADVSFWMTFVVVVLFEVIYPVQSAQNIHWLVWISALVMMILYFTVFEWLYGATPGKLILKMRVVGEDGSPCRLGPALARGVLRLWDELVFGWVAKQSMEEPLQQRYGDRLAHTLVVGSHERVIQQPRAWWRFLAAVLVYLAVESLSILLWMMILTR